MRIPGLVAPYGRLARGTLFGSICSPPGCEELKRTFQSTLLRQNKPQTKVRETLGKYTYPAFR